MPFPRCSFLFLLGLACSTPSSVREGKPKSTSLQSVRIGEEALTPFAFVSSAEFLFPEEMQSARRTILRAEIARREGLRLNIEVPATEADEALEAALRNLRAELGNQTDLESWCRQRWGCSLTQFASALKQRLSANLLYQRVMRAWVCQGPTWEVQVIGVGSQKEAEEYFSRLRLGADPRTWDFPIHQELLAETSLAPIGPSLKNSTEGDVLGPFQLPGDENWFLLRVQKKRSPSTDLLPQAVLKDGLVDLPPGPLESRSWWEAMLRRYTASESPSAILNPPRSFVPF